MFVQWLFKSAYVNVQKTVNQTRVVKCVYKLKTLLTMKFARPQRHKAAI